MSDEFTVGESAAVQVIEWLRFHESFMQPRVQEREFPVDPVVIEVWFGTPSPKRIRITVEEIE